MEKKKTFRAYPLTHHQPFRYWSIHQILKSFHDPESDIFSSLILSGATLTFSPQEFQDKFLINPGIISEPICKIILQISDNHFSACRSSTNWIIWSAEHHDPSFFIIAPCSSWLQFWWNKHEASKYLSSQPISQHLLLLLAIQILVLLLGTRISRQ